MQSRYTSRLFSLAFLGALACSSEQDNGTTEQPAVTATTTTPVPMATGGDPNGPCASAGDGYWIYDHCNQPTGPCHSKDGVYTRTNCQDVNTQTPPATGTTTLPPVNPPVTTPTGTVTGTPTAPTTVDPNMPVTTPTTPVDPNMPVTTPTTPVDPNMPVTTPTTPVDPNTPPTDMPAEVTPPEGRTCPVVEGLVADFEESKPDVIAIEGRAGAFEGYGDESGTQTTEVIDEGADACNKGVLHTSGSGFSSYVGIGAVFSGTWDQTKKDGAGEYVPDIYDATAAGFTGITFRAKKGSGQQNAVRFSLATPWTEGGDYGDGSCVDEAGHVTPCWDHLGQFLIDDEDLTADWKTFTFYFDRDLYPMWLPNGVTTENRRKVGSNLLKIQFQFNQAFDTEGTQVAMDGGFDFFLDDVRLVKGEPTPAIFASTDGASDPFGSNAKLGSCDMATDGPLFNTAISQAYARWRAKFVQNDGGVISPEQNNKITSEGISYGMLITAAIGDKATFDKIWGWAKGKTNGGTTLLGWDNGGGGSATDADVDIAYALLLADKQWGGYKDAAVTMGSLAQQKDLDGNIFKGGENYPNVYNPSYFAPGYLRAMNAAGAGSWGGAITANYDKLNSCDSSFSGSDGIVSDWCGGASGAQVTSEVCASGVECSAYDASRVPYRIGFDVCMGGTEGSAFIGKTIATFESLLEAPGRFDLLKAGMAADKNQDSAVQFEMAFLGTAGVGAMGAGDADARDQLFRATLDVMERPEYYNTYYSASLGMITLLMMSGNWPAL